MCFRQIATDAIYGAVGLTTATAFYFEGRIAAVDARAEARAEKAEANAEARAEARWEKAEANAEARAEKTDAALKDLSEKLHRKRGWW